MGNINSLFTTNPSEILPVEAYLSDLCETAENLGSTRFMKVAKGKTSEGIFVYKVFVRQDNSSLNPYPEKLIEIRNSLAKSPNCCAVKKVVIKQKCAVVLRTYQKNTLFDRMSTRPFVIQAEKIWYIYQLFKGLAQCEAANVCHGDLKSQNILISSSNWLQITDFAPFKPTFLPKENPSSYTFFFDTSRRQSCYIAPERFLNTNEYEICQNGGKLFGGLKSSMDMFSAGCIVYELLCDGRAPFTYSTLCEYQSMSNSEANNHLARLQQDIPPQFRALLKLLLTREPTLRLSANAVLSGAAFSFPPILENFLFKYLDLFRPLYHGEFKNSANSNKSDSDFSQPLDFSYMEPDDVIAKLKKEKNLWLSKISENPDNQKFGVLFVSLITSNLRGLRTIQSKTDAMDLLVELGAISESSISIDRILPYFVHFMNDAETQVRSMAIRLSADLLESVQPMTYEESLLFVDYLFPEISSLMTDDCPQHVLFSIALSLGSLADSAYRFLKAGREIRSGSYDDEVSTAENLDTIQQTYSDDSAALHQGISAIFSSLCSRDPNVKLCLVEPKSLKKLCQFFKDVGNGDNLLTFLITFLNAKIEWRLRAAFFDALLISVQNRSVGLVPLLQQGLQDNEEYVVLRALGCIHIFIMRNDILEKQEIKVLLNEIVVFLVHPNEWIRSAVCDILVGINEKWHMADVHVKVLPQVTPYVMESKRKLLSLRSKIVLMSVLIPPIDRSTFTKMAELSLENTKTLVDTLELHYEKNRPFEVAKHWFTSIFPKVENEKDLEERKRLLATIFPFRGLLLKMADTRNTAGLESFMTRQNGTIDLSSKQYTKIRQRKFVYGKNDEKEDKLTINSPTIVLGGVLEGEIPLEEERINNTAGGNTMRSSIFEHQVNSMLAHMNEIHQRNVTSKRSAMIHSAVGGSGMFGRPNSTIKGTIITHLHEHSAKITKLAATRSAESFASGSADGTVRIWRTKSVLGEGYGAVRSEDTWIPSENRQKVKSIGWNENYLCAATEDGVIRWADVSNGGAKLQTMLRIPEDEGPPVFMQTNGAMTFVRTHHGVLYGLDLRVGQTSGGLGRHEVWRRKLRDDHGLINCSAIDPWQQSWMILGTNSHLKNMLLYDLRFKEEVLRWDSPHKYIRPSGVWANPASNCDKPDIFVAFNMHGEVSNFEICAQPIRKRVLWTGGTPVMNYEPQKNNKTHADLSQLQTKACVICPSTGNVYTGDSRGTIRKWNVNKASNCEVISSQPDCVGNDDLLCIYERHIVDTEAKENRRIVPLDSKPSTYHRTPITDLLLLAPDLMLSSSFDGIIKVWK
ncbi:unnamed protein product [Caenorhabditis angaria]|uniref:non-specific serine/threonine protein kinase n=1 Tax=Caenorhabditis angaria TaxID=860376 RepID=A0A9P1IHU0_9PELO|nr:unnamed protein product [Caenorhabditis angaria]